MDKSIQITLIIVAGVIILGFLGYLAISQINPSNTITANGQASIDVIPDLVGIYFNVQTEGETSKEASDANAEIVDDLITALIREGFDRDEIQTMNFNVYPNYVWDDGSRTLKGYMATHQIKVELSTDDTEGIGEAVDAGINAGAGISYINFELSQGLQNEYKKQAIALASEDAKLKAEAIAEGLDKNLGSIVSVSDSNFNYYPWMLYQASGAANDAALAKEAATDIQPGEQTIYASVNAVFKIR